MTRGDRKKEFMPYHNGVPFNVLQFIAILERSVSKGWHFRELVKRNFTRKIREFALVSSTGNAVVVIGIREFQSASR
jgi:hypothetical protein